MEFLRWLMSDELHRGAAMLGAGGPYGLPSLIGALVFAWIWYSRARAARGRQTSLKGFLRSVFSRRILLHPSSRLDMKMWALNGFVLGTAYAVFAVGGLACRNLTISALTSVFGEHAPLAWPVWLVIALSTLLELLAYELAYWFGHYLFHRFESLWEFHKVHHSAEVMTTFTELRQHPVEIMAFVNLITFATGTMFGALTYVFGPGAHPFTLLNANIVLMLFLLTWGHLRHSQMWISFRGLAGHLLQSPAHHQIHHSDSPLHWDKNLGFSLAIWDWVFGTLYSPAREREDIRFGVGETHGEFDTVGKAFVGPVVRFVHHVTPPAPEAAAPHTNA